MRDEAPPDLIRRASNDRAAFAQLYDHYLPRIYAFCHRYGQNREDAEDLTAEVFEKALAAIGRYEDRGLPFSAWLLRIAANAVIDRARRLQPPAISAEELSRLAEDSFLEEWEQAYWLRMHVAALPADQREVVRLRFYEDQRFADVARRMGRSEGAVKQLLRRALRALRLQLREEADEDSTHE
jgi:RNA polymerase sigma-70 factor (ECF subfamily)